MLDQGLAGEGGGFRTNWNMADDDSDEADEYYQKVIDTPQKQNPQDEAPVTEDPTKLSPRYERAITIILDAKPDIVTVQECDRKNVFEGLMKFAGYECVFNEKTASAATRNGNDYRAANALGLGVHMDNVGIFWNKVTFQKVYGPRKIFLPNAKKGSLEGMGKQAGMWVLLRNKVTKRLTAVVTAHNKSGAEKGEDAVNKRTQADRLAEILRDELGPNVPIIFGCDFNNGTETESYADFRRQVPFMAEAYEDTYGMSPTWGSSKWRSGGAQTEKIGFTPNNIDFVFYNRRFFKALGVLAYPNWEEEDLEACNLPGYKYPSDHFAHMALFEEREVTPEQALLEEMYHLVKRNKVTPAHNKEVRNDAGQLERTDYRFYFPDVKAPLANAGVTAEHIVATFYKYRSYLRRSDENDWANLKILPEDPAVNLDALAGELAAGFADFGTQFDAVNFDMYKTKVTVQAGIMNKHNQMRCDMEKEGAVYRTYTILKHLILCAGGKVTLEMCTPKLLLDGAKAKFECANKHKKLYKKFDKLPITEAEVNENLDAAKALWVRKFIRKTKRKKHFAADRAEWSGENLRNYDLTGRELEMMSQEALLGAFSDAQNIQQGQLIDHILQGLRQPQAPQQAPVGQPMRNPDEEKSNAPQDQVAAPQSSRPQAGDNSVVPARGMPLETVESGQGSQLRRRLMEQ